LDIGGTDYDVAYVKWGGNWRIPNKEEFSETRNKCSWEWTLINDVKGYKVTGTNGNSIFLPFNRGKMEVSESRSKEGSAYYWTNTLTSEKTKAICYSISTGYRMVKNLDDVYYGLPIRAVME
jgi:uncharacterized protein (TIGR02145 family)